MPGIFFLFVIVEHQLVLNRLCQLIRVFRLFSLIGTFGCRLAHIKFACHHVRDEAGTVFADEIDLLLGCVGRFLDARNIASHFSHEGALFV